MDKDQQPKRYARSHKEIARTLGLSEKPKSLDEIGTWMKRADFPRKSAKGWLRDDLKDWHAKFLGELPPQSAPPDGELLSPANFDASLDLWEDKLVNPTKWLASPIQAWQVKILREQRPKLFPKKEEPISDEGAVQDDPSPHVVGLSNAAKWLSRKFSVHIEKQHLANWRAGNRIGAAPKFPDPDAGWRFKKTEIADWFRKYKLEQFSKSGHNEFDFTAIKREQAQIDLRAAQRREDYEMGRLVLFAPLKPVVAGLGDGLAKLYEKWLEGENGVRRIVKEQAQSCGVPPETVGVLDARLALLLPQIVDGIKKEAQEFFRNAQNAVDEIKREQMEGNR